MPHKYHAKPTEVDGIKFASKAEAHRYGELKMLAKAGKIECLELQPAFPLHCRLDTPRAVGGAQVGIYRADFRYFDMTTGADIVEDVKGMITPLAKWKIKHCEKQYGIRVQIVKMR